MKNGLVIIDAGSHGQDGLGGGQLASLKVLAELRSRTESANWKFYLITAPERPELRKAYAPLCDDIFTLTFLRRYRREHLRIPDYGKLLLDLGSGVREMRRLLRPLIQQHGKDHLLLFPNENHSRTMVALSNIIGPRIPSVSIIDNEYNKGMKDYGLLKLWDRGISHYLAVCKTLADALPPTMRARAQWGYVGVEKGGIRNLATAPRPSTPFRIGWIGSLVPFKRADWAMRVSERLHEDSGTPVELHIIGDGPAREQLEGESTERTHFHGRLSQHDAWKTLAGMHLLLHTSRTEAMPLVLFEACALGLPIVASAVGGIPEIVRPAQNGYLADPNLIHEYIDGAGRILMNPAEQRRMALGSLQMTEAFGQVPLSGTFASLLEEREFPPSSSS